MRKSEWAVEVRRAATAVWNANSTLATLLAESTSGGYGLPPEEGGIDEAVDLVGVNEGITKEELIAVVGTTGPALQALLDAGHGTNIVNVLLTQ